MYVGSAVVAIGARGAAPRKFKRHHSGKFDVFGKNRPRPTFDSLLNQCLICHFLTNTLNSLNLFVSFGQGHGNVFFLGGGGGQTC